MPVGDLLPEIALLLGGVGCILLAAFTPQARQGLSAGLALLVLPVAGVLAAGQWGGSPRLTFSGTWALDPVAVAAKLLIIACTAIVVVLSPEWMRRDRRHGEYYGLLLFAALGAVVMAAASDTMELVIGVLLSSAASYPLAAYHRAWAPSLEAGMKYYLLAALTNALLAVGAVLLFGLTGDTGYAATASALADGADPVALIAAVSLVVIGLAFKMGAFPAHAWMPDVAQGAPAPVAAFLTVVPKIGAAVALTRFVLLLPAELAWPWIIAFIAVVTMTLGNLAALRQTDVRRLLGWSSVSQSGYALMAVTVVATSDRALGALLVFLAGYAVANLAAFAVVVLWRGRTALDDYRGLAAVQPGATTVLVLALLSLVGIPPTIGFFGKLLLFRAAIDGGYAWLAVVAAVNTVISLYYYLRVVAKMVLAPRDAEVHRLGPLAGLGCAVGGIAVIGLGLAAEALVALPLAMAPGG